MFYLPSPRDLELVRDFALPRYFRRDGSAYPPGRTGLMEWARDMEKVELRRVARTRTIYGEDVSTGWLGSNHAFFGGPPLIFETMVFRKGTAEDIICLRYSKEAEAVRGHWRTWWQTFVPPSLRARCFEEWR